jgi:4-hydroxybenzoate polyprenyltransferase
MAGAAALLIWKFSIIHMLLVGISSLLCVMYQLPYGVSLRNNGILKPISIAFAWALNTVLLASADQFEFIPNDHSVIYSTISIFSLTFILALFYDLKDSADEEHKYSFAVKIGIQNTLKIAIISMVTLILFGLVYFRGIAKETAALSGATVYLLFIYSKILKGKGSTYIIDSCFIVYALILLTCKHLIQ